MKKKHWIGLVIVLFILALAASRIRIANIGDQRIVLYHNPFQLGSGSIRHDLLEDLERIGKDPEKVEELSYYGTDRKGGLYYLGKYVEDDGTVTEFWGFDDNDLTSTVRAAIIWYAR